MKKLATLIASSLAAAGCMSSGPGDTSSAQQGLAEQGRYEDIADSPTIDQGAWFDATSALNGEFVAACPGEFCGGDISPFVPLTFGCSVASDTGAVAGCSWTFGASDIAVDPETAAIDSNVPTYVCPVSLTASAPDLLTFLQQPDALHAVLPGETTSIDDQLSGCFEHPIDSTPFTLNSGSTYVAASDYYSLAWRNEEWVASQSALLVGFNDVCGDTFCGSDYGDLQSLDFECSVTRSTGNVRSCAWFFTGSFHTVDAASGQINQTTSAFRCVVPVKGTLSELITTLTAAGSTAPIQRPLPGEPTSAYDALGGCLP